MPELPEVETVVRSLEETIAGTTPLSIRFNRKDLREPIPVPLVKEILIGHRLIRIHRRAKYILLSNSSGSVFFHLGMSGSMLVLPSSKEKHPHTHIVITLKKNSCPPVFLHFIDPRRFGRIGAIRGRHWETHPFFSKLGPEPLGQESLPARLQEKGETSKRTIKALIMDPSVVVGVGNIYACESLFCAKIDPLRPSCQVTKPEYNRLAKCIKKILCKAIDLGGTTLQDFKNLEGKPGYFSLSLTVYGRDGEACKRCNTKIESCRIGGRGTWFCPECQI